MFEELNKYNDNDHFFFETSDSLDEVCNAPADKDGIYLVYALKNGKIELIYIGNSGKIEKNGSMYMRKAGLGGIKDSIVNGRQFGKTPRKTLWPQQMLKENIEVLDIYWYTTDNDKLNDCPMILENELLLKHFDLFGRLPKWNIEI